MITNDRYYYDIQNDDDNNNNIDTSQAAKKQNTYKYTQSVSKSHSKSLAKPLCKDPRAQHEALDVAWPSKREHKN